MSLQYRDDLQAGISREEIEMLERFVQVPNRSTALDSHVQDLCDEHVAAGVTVKACGGYRRGKNLCKVTLCAVRR